jgi:hypothetical protein
MVDHLYYCLMTESISNSRESNSLAAKRSFPPHCANRLDWAFRSRAASVAKAEGRFGQKFVADCEANIGYAPGECEELGWVQPRS